MNRFRCRRRRRQLPAAALLFLAIASAAWAQPEGPLPPAPAPSTEEQVLIRQLLQRVSDLEAQVRELRAEQAKKAPPAATPAPPAPESADPKAPAEDALLEQIKKQLRDESRGLQLRGFADIAFRTSDRKGSTSSFALGEVDLFITSRLSDKLSVLFEYVGAADTFGENAEVTVAHAGGGARNAIEFDIERLLLQYSVSELLNVAFGRYHTTIGYYNAAYHHGAWLETAANRPFLFAYEHEGGILPTHNVGLSATGSIPSGRLGLRYVFELGNGRTSRSSTDVAVQNGIDENNGKALHLGFFARPDEMPGLQTGFSVYRDKLRPAGLPVLRQTIYAAHAVYQSPRFEWLNEGALVHHSGGGRTFDTPAFYTQIARQFGKFRPFLRYQYVNAPRDEPIYLDVGRRRGPSIGVRYDLDNSTALKLQLDHTARRGQRSINELTLQSAFTF